jgi:hypothetical protein
MNQLIEGAATPPLGTCTHTPRCPAWNAPDHDAAVVIFNHHVDCGCVVLCNRVTVFDDGGELLPDGTIVPAHRPEPLHALAVA